MSLAIAIPGLSGIGAPELIICCTPLLVLVVVTAIVQQSRRNEPGVFIPAVPPLPASWAADPSGRHQLRYWNGTAWTADVSDDGVQAVDPL